jgi:7-keto-8-aminopelargonate synthetase-like enzyme
MSIGRNWLRERLTRVGNLQSEIARVGINGLMVAGVRDKLITLTDGTQLTDFATCSYLSLNQHPRIIEATQKALIDHSMVMFSVARTRMRFGIFAEAEENLSRIARSEDAITFGSVTATHTGVLPLLASGELPGYEFQRPIFVLDRNAHASMQINRGILAEFGEVRRVDFANLDAVAEAFASARTSGFAPISVSDSVGSMGGEVPVADLVSLAEKYRGFCYFDDAHGMSVFGKRGAGFVHETFGDRIPPRVVLTSSTAKGFGAYGGTFVGSSAACGFVRKHAMTYAFSGGPSVPDAGAILESSRMHLEGLIEPMQAQLQANVREFDAQFGDRMLNAGRRFPIRGLVVGDERRALATSASLKRQGFLATTAIFPTVAKGAAMLRFVLGLKHTKDDFERLRAALAVAEREALNSRVLSQ